MKINQFRRSGWLLLLNATVLALAPGCATHHQRSYNQDFNQNLPTSPRYSIEDVSDTHFQVVVHQGSSLAGPQRVIYVKEAAAAVVESEAKRRGWQNWNLEYVQERDRGWMHIVIADVTRKNAVKMTPGPTSNNP